MRAVLLTFIFFVAVGLLWAIQVPLSSFARIREFKEGSMSENLRQALRQAGPGARLALRSGIESGEGAIRLECARIAAEAGDREGDACLLELLRRHGKPGDPLGAAAEFALLSAWDKRESPGAAARREYLTARESGDEEELEALDKLLTNTSNWSAGYARRAHIHHARGDGLFARRDAMIALIIEPNHFEAMTILAQAHVLLGAPEQALQWMKAAVHTNPRLTHTHREEIREILRAVDFEKMRRRREKRKEVPIA